MANSASPATRPVTTPLATSAIADPNQIKLPSDYYFGITAASADTPDTFEVYKFVTTTSNSVAREEPQRHQAPPPQREQHQQQRQQQQHYEDTQASRYTSQDAQFADLHNRLQIMAHAIDNIQQTVSKLSESAEGRHQEISRNVMSGDQLNAMDQRLQGIERTFQDYQKEFQSLQFMFRDTHGNLMQSIPAHMTDSESSPSPWLSQLSPNVTKFSIPRRHGWVSLFSCS